MSILNRLGISEDKIKELVERGIISTSVIRGFEVYDRYVELKTSLPNTSDAKIFNQMSDEFKMSNFNIKRIVRENR